jgi:hypothetical protein
MPTERISIPLTSDPAEDTAALNELIALGLIDAVDGNDGPAYRLSEALYADDFAPNAALRARLQEPSSGREPHTLKR